MQELILSMQSGHMQQHSMLFTRFQEITYRELQKCNYELYFVIAYFYEKRIFPTQKIINFASCQFYFN